MGVCSNKSEALNHVEEITQLLDIDNPGNVNHKYANNITLIPNQYIGTGIKITNQYQTNFSKMEWEEMQKAFWDSHKDNSQWQIIRKVLSCNDESKILKILKQANLKLIRNSIQLLVQDNSKQIFQVPVFIINEPISWSNQNFELKFETSMLKVRVKSSKLPQDFEIQVSSTSKIYEIKLIILEAAKEKTCRLFFNGKELVDQNQLGNYSISSGTVIQAFL
ncbi:unnamed protein product [Paramecium sonneborni]|uniref:Ubiquitin-like domain-containing protein n=1 Tax=Paramecium sonneborni TaxID=65129 RepID=A0A8S1JV24_9CILI|nr:unnamed protein product [Paramecium sonneborni]